jgi:4-alpha-glucanotransferase
VPGPGKAFFRAVREQLGDLPLIAEDLGLITPQVDALREALELPGMRVLQFAFGDDDRNPHLPANHEADTVAYTGTHDNDTSLGWYRNAVGDAERQRLRALFSDPAEEIHWAMIRLAWNSVARYALAPLQDVLGMGSEARMNTPGVAEGNWTWRFAPGALTSDAARRLREITRDADRLASAAAVHPVTASGKINQ